MTARASGARVTVTAVGVGRTTIRLTAADPADPGLSGSQSFGVRVTAPFTDDPLRPGRVADHQNEADDELTTRRSAVTSRTPTTW